MKMGKQNLILILILTLLTSCSEKKSNKLQTTDMQKSYLDDFELTPEKANPKAKELLTEDFYWSPIIETGPFGNDDGSDAFYGFLDWRKSNPTTSPTSFISQLISEWGYQTIDYNELNQDVLRKHIQSNNLGSRTLVGQDQAIIAVGFGQFVLEGKIEKDLKGLTRNAIKRELLPILVNEWDEKDRMTRTKRLNIMLADLDKMND